MHSPVHNSCNMFVNNVLFYISPTGGEKKWPCFPHVFCVDNIKLGICTAVLWFVNGLDRRIGDAERSRLGKRNGKRRVKNLI